MRRAGLIALATAVLAVPARAADPGTARLSDLATAPLEQVAFASLPAVYRVTATFHVGAVRDIGRTFPIDRDVAIQGVAFGVAPGRVATARHIVRPSNRTIVDLALAARTPGGLPDDPTRLRAIWGTPRIRLTRASTEAAQVAAGPAELAAKIAATSDADGDLALLAIDDPDAPTLALTSDLSAGTPIVAVVVDTVADEPAARVGEIIGRRRLSGTQNDGFGTITAPIARGDSGAPVLDAAGTVRGVVQRVRTLDAPPLVGSAGALRRLIEAQRLEPVANGVTDTFRLGMAAFWKRDYGTAAETLGELRGRYRDTSLAQFEALRARDLDAARFTVLGPSRLRGAILALGAMATIAAAIFGGLLLRRRPLL